MFYETKSPALFETGRDFPHIFYLYIKTSTQIQTSEYYPPQTSHKIR